MKRARAWILAGGAMTAAAVFSWVAASYRSELQAANARISIGSSVAQTPCGPIEFSDRGNGPPVLVVHGAGGGFDQGAEFAEELSSAGYRVIAMSRFGYLRTPLPADASAQAQADGHACLLDSLRIPGAAIIGISAGAPSSLQFALRHPHRCTALVLLVPAAYVPRPDDAPSMHTPAATPVLFDTALRFDFLFWLATKVARDTMMAAILATPPEVIANASAEEQSRADRMLDRILPVSARRLGLLNDAAVTSSLQREPLDQVKAPTLVISLDDDQFGTLDGATYVAQHIPGARMVRFERGGHVWIGHHEEVMTALKVHLPQHDPAGSRPEGTR
jgi:pimeloyl-ACP methyl ester carboxylesterase